MNTVATEAAAISLRQADQGGDDARLDAYVRQMPSASLYHLSAWRDLIQRVFGHQSCVLMAEQRGHIVGMLPLVRLRSLLFGDYMVSMPYFNYGGPVVSEAGLADRLMEAAGHLAKELGASHIEFRDTEPRGGDFTQRTDKVSMVLSLPDHPQALWNVIGTKTRNRIRHPKKQGAVVRHGGPELLNDFYEVFCRNMRYLGTPVYPKRFFAEMIQDFPDCASLTTVSHGGRPVAAAFLLGHRGRLEIPWASSLREANHLAVNMLLYWAVLERAIEEGYQAFDFGRSTVGSGTHAFKKQWGAQERQLYWHYWLKPGTAMPGLSPDNPKFALAIRLWRRLPLSVTRWVGPLVVRNLP